MISFKLVALFSAVFAATTVVAHAGENGLRAGIISLAEMKDWVAAQDPENIALIDDPFGNVTPLSITVTFCSTRSGSVCTGPCTVRTGSGICIDAPNTNCLSATGQVSFCDRAGCGGSCNVFNSCGTRLDNNFCFTPGTRSIGIPAGA